ncbi:hypothetical protein VIC_001181 [Vibrio coralliilyticus ATCC BAA-450]|nr:hypothetical protein VIC_001181 [Vibrio coralliilyticus ATCC BAA-450]
MHIPLKEILTLNDMLLMNVVEYDARHPIDMGLLASEQTT